jgi:hypothetical protein
MIYDTGNFTFHLILIFPRDHGVRQGAFKEYNNPTEKCEKPTSIPRSSVCRPVFPPMFKLRKEVPESLVGTDNYTFGKEKIYLRASNSAFLLRKNSYITTIFAVGRFIMGTWG